MYEVFMVAPPKNGWLERSMSIIVQASSPKEACRLAQTNIPTRIPFAVKRAPRDAEPWIG